MVKSAKDTIYIDIEDEITAIIEKLNKSDGKIVALVLPKRATTMQSVVNLKLLKKSAKTAKKNLVLITSDSSIIPIAGIVGLHVAKTLQSKPEIPKVQKVDNDSITIESELAGIDPENEPDLDPSTSIGKLAGDTEETIDVTDDEEESKTKKPKKTKNRKLKVPNFDKFRTKLFIAVGLLLLLLGGGYLVAFVLPKATIDVTTNTNKLDYSVDFESKNDIADVDLDKNIVPMHIKEIKKTSVEKVPTTGKRDDGNKATGKMTLTNCVKEKEFNLPAGTVFSSSGLNFVSTKEVTLAEATYQGSNCKSEPDDGNVKTVDVIADTGGSRYNVSARSYSVPSNYQTSSGSVIASGSAMSGGTTQLVSVVSQADLDSAKQQAIDKMVEETKTELTAIFVTEQSIGLDTSLENLKVTSTGSPEVGNVASEVSVTVNVTYTMYGIKRELLTKVLEKEIKNNIDNNNQAVQNTGIDEADIRITDKSSPNNFKINFQSSATIGPNLDSDSIKKEIAGKRRSQTEDIIKSRPGVKEVKVKYSPFWVFNNPKNIKQIKLNFKTIDADK